jgi:hypothetical protein
MYYNTMNNKCIISKINNKQSKKKHHSQTTKISSSYFHFQPLYPAKFFKTEYKSELD